MNIIRDLTKVNFENGGNTKRYIVIHYTGNYTDTAKNNANYFRDVYRGGSAHYFVDEKDIYQCVEDNNISWGVGVNYGSNNLFGKVTNYNCINIEMCSTNGVIAEATYKNTVELTKYLMNKYNIPASNVVRHWDVCTKQCPGWNGWGTGGNDASIWNTFKKDIINGTVSSIKVNHSVETNTSRNKSLGQVNATYAVQTNGNKWWEFITNKNDVNCNGFAGAGDGVPITGIAIKVDKGSVKYRVHILGVGWLPYVTGCNINDFNNGYAGDGRTIDAVEVYYITPDGYEYQQARYRVSPIASKAYYSEQIDNFTSGGMDGYAGEFGIAIDKFRLYIQ